MRVVGPLVRVKCSDEEKKERQGLIKQHIRDGYLTYAVLGNIVIISCA